MASQNSRNGALCDLSEDGYKFDGGYLDGIKIGAVGRQVREPSIGGLDAVVPALELVGREVVEDDGDALRQYQNQCFNDACAEAFTVRGPIKKRGRDQTISERRDDQATFAVRGASVVKDHADVDRSLV